MKYTEGDKIIILQSDEEGKVVEIINDKMVMVNVNGVQFPVYTDQIDFPYFKMFSKKPEPKKQRVFVDQLKTEKPAKRKKTRDGVFVNVIPIFDRDVFGDELVDKIKLYLINYNEDDYSFKYQFHAHQQVKFQHEGIIYGLQDFYLHDIPFEELSYNPELFFEFSLKKTDKTKVPFYTSSIKWRGKQVYQKIHELQEKNEPSFEYEIFTHYPDKPNELTIDLSKLYGKDFRMHEDGKSSIRKDSVQSVIDLHIEKLIDHHVYLSDPEILETQLTFFEKYLDEAIMAGKREMIFIHGVGEGVLKKNIHEKLKQHRQVSSFVNRQHPLFGYGATEVFLK